MRIKFEGPVKTMSLETFGTIYNLTLTIGWRGTWAGTVRPHSGPPFYASFEYVDVKDDGILSSVFGEGATEHEAVVNYANKIQGQPLVYNAYGDARTEFVAPLWLTVTDQYTK